MRKKLLFVAVMAMLLAGAVACNGKKTSALESLVEEIKTELPADLDDGDSIEDIYLTNNTVFITIKPEKEHFADFMEELANEPESYDMTREQVVEGLMASVMRIDLLKEIYNAGAGVGYNFIADSTGRCTNVAITPDEVKQFYDANRDVIEDVE